MTKNALITGITGQDGAYLARLLLDKGYRVTGFSPRRGSDTLWRLRELGVLDRIELVYGDVTDLGSVAPCGSRYQAGRALQPRRAELRRRLVGSVRAYGAGRCDRRGQLPGGDPPDRSADPLLSGVDERDVRARSQSERQSESTPFYPRSPYGVAKLYGALDHRQLPRELRPACVQRHPVQSRVAAARHRVRHAQGHRRRGADQARARRSELRLGNIDAKRDWGFAGDYVEAMWLMLQQERPDDYVIATGISDDRTRHVPHRLRARRAGLRASRRRGRQAAAAGGGRRAVRRPGEGAGKAGLGAEDDARRADRHDGRGGLATPFGPTVSAARS